MHRPVAFLGVFALVVPLHVETAAGDCAPSGLAPKVLNGSTAATQGADEGGLVVGAVPDALRRSLDKGDISVQKAWQFGAQGKKTAPKIETLAPGLSVYRAQLASLEREVATLVAAQRERDEAQRALADAKVKYQDAHPTVASAQARLSEAQRRARHAEAAIPKVELLDDKGTVLGSLDHVPKAARTAAPKVKTITHARDMGRRSLTQVAVTLDGDPPAGVVALVLADAKGTARSWTAVDPAAMPKSVLYPFRTHSCMQVPNGTLPSSAGDSVVVFWIDATGRKSDASKPIAITAAKP